MLLETGAQALDARLNLIANAESSLVVGTYLFADDQSGRTIAAVLLNAADRGVHVRVLTDGLVGWGNLLTSDLGYAMGTHPLIELRYYNPVNALTPWGLNARYHEKYVIADDRVFVLGGRNISDEFLTKEGDPAYNYDMDVLVYRDAPSQDSACAALTTYFDALWDAHCTPWFETAPTGKGAAVETLQAELRTTYQTIASEHAQAVSPYDYSAATMPIDGFWLINNPTTPGVKQPTAWAELVGLMSEATKRVWIQTPYLVLNARMRDDLSAVAALPSELRVVTNSRASGNNIVASADMLIHKGMLTRMDMALYEFQGDHSMHTKTLLIDSDVSIFGSFNFDIRSAYIDTEVMLAIKSEALNQELERHMLSMQSASILDGTQESEPAATPKEISWSKDLLIHIASPFISLIRFLI